MSGRVPPIGSGTGCLLRAIYRGIRLGQSRKPWLVAAVAAAGALGLPVASAFSAAPASTYFVSPSGNDSNSCLTADEACLTIQAAVGKASAGDAVDVASGTYVENLTISKQLELRCANAGISAGWNAGTRGAETIIRGQADLSAAGTVIDGCQFTRPDVATSQTPRLIESIGVSGQITVKNSVINLQPFGAVDPNLRGCGAGTYGTAAWRIYDNSFKFHRYSAAVCTADLYSSRMVNADSAQKIIVDGNAFYRTDHSIFITGTNASNSEVTNNTFSQLATAGVFLGTPQGTLIKGNTFSGYGGVYLDKSTNTVIENNSFAAEGWYALLADSSHSGTVVRNNSVLGKYPAGYAGYTGITVFNNGAASIDANTNWWGSVSEANVRSLIKQNPGTVTSSSWITSFVADPSMAGKPGFWPLIPEAQAATPVSAEPVSVELSGFFNGSSVGITFEGGVSGAGLTAVTAYTEDPTSPLSGTYPEQPAGFRLGDPPVYFTISTTATSSGDRRLCFGVPPGSFPSSVTPALYHFTGGSWVVVADSSYDSNTRQLCGTVSSFSPFAAGAVPAGPSNSTAPVITGTASSGQTLSTDDGTWTGFPETFTYSYQWQRCNADGSGCTNVGSNQDSYVLASSDVGKKIKVTVTASNGVSPDGRATSSLTSVVEGPPVNTIAPSISSSPPQVGDTVTGDDGTWAGYPALTSGDFTYQWQRSDTGTGSWSDIASATGKDYPVIADDLHKYLRLVVTADNGVGSAASEDSNATGQVDPADSAPQNVSAPVITGTASSGQTLSTDDGTWTGFPETFTYSYQWQRCNADGSGCTNVGSNQDSYVLASSDVGKKIKVTVTASNGVSPDGQATSSLTEEVGSAGVLRPTLKAAGNAGRKSVRVRVACGGEEACRVRLAGHLKGWAPNDEVDPDRPPRTLFVRMIRLAAGDQQVVLLRYRPGLIAKVRARLQHGGRWSIRIRAHQVSGGTSYLSIGSRRTQPDS